MIWVVLALVALAIGLVTVGVFRGRIRLDGLGEPVHTVPDVGLPREFVADDLDRVRFDTALRGYDPLAVDQHLDALRDHLAGRAPDRTNTPDTSAFEVVLRGYRMDQVDDVIARATDPATTRRLHELLLTEGAVQRVGTNLSDGLEPSSAEVRAEAEVGAGEGAGALRRWLRGYAARLPEYRLPAKLKRTDLLAPAAYALMALWLLSRVVLDPQGTYLSQGVQDQQAFEWYFGAAAHSLSTLSNPLLSTLQNYPTGVNMLANATVLGLSIPLAPLTLLAGPHVTFVLIEWIGFFATATCWYLLFVRRLHVHRAAATLGGALMGFSPAMVSHGNGHPNFLAQFLIPVILDRLIDLQRRGRTRAQTLRAGVVLGLLVTWQLWQGEEVLLLACVGIAIVAAVMVAHRRLDLRALLPGTLVGVATTVVLFAFPLWWQFFGPQSYRTMWQPVANNDLASLWGRATRTWFSDPWAAHALSMNRTEENAFFGIPLWLLAIGIVILLWKRPIVRASAALILLTSWLSLGSTVTLHDNPVPVPGLWSLARHLPLFDGLLPTRFTMIAVPGFAVLLTVALDAALKGSYAVRGRTLTRPVALGATALALVVALAPILPTRLWADPRPEVPAFFSSGQWRDWVDDGSVLGVPPPDIRDMRAIDWQASARWDFPLVEGYFMGPDGSGSRKGARGALRLPFSTWLAQIEKSGEPAVATAAEVEQFRADLVTWRTDLVVLTDRPHHEALRTSVESVLGPAQKVDDVLLWDVRGGAR